ncbi:MAG: hypothetical protein RR361_07815, partial [Anaerovorax sp.]
MKNLFVVHGADHKVGTTMISQSIAEYLSNEYKELKVLFITLNGRESAEYVNEAPESIEGIKNHLDSKMIEDIDFTRVCKKRDNFYMLTGIKKEEEQRDYYPHMATYLLETVTQTFDIVIADSGNELDNGLAIGALSATVNRFLVMTQQEAILYRWERNRMTYERLGIDFDRYIINKYYEQDPYDVSYIGKRLNLLQEQFLKVAFAGYGRQAEMEYKTL